jgi:thioredoxin 1
MAARVNKDNFAQQVLAEKLPVLVEFYSDSCIPCKQMSPILGDIEDDYEDRLRVCKVNVNFDEELAGQYEVMSSPTLLFFKDGQEVERVRGLVKKPELTELVERVIAE